MLFLLPLLPAFRELVRPRDVAALPVPVKFDLQPDKFATRFRQYLAYRLGGDPDLVVASIARAEQYLHGSGFHVIGRNGAPCFDANEQSSRATCKLLLGVAIELPAGFTFKQEVFATRELRVGDNATLRAVYAQAGLRIGEGSRLQRWAHAARVQIGPRCHLQGRVTADECITIGPGTIFGRLNAPRIDFCGAGEHLGEITYETSGTTVACVEFPNRVELASNDPRTIVRGDANVPRGGLVKGDLIAYGDVQVGRSARVLGSVKAHGRLTIAPDARVEGALIAVQDLEVGCNAHVDGPVSGEHVIYLQPGSRVGASDALTSVVAPVIRVAAGSVVFGTVWAEADGLALDHTATQQEKS